MTTTTPQKPAASTIQPILVTLGRAAHAPIADRSPDVKGLKTTLEPADLDRIYEEPERWDGLA